MVLLTLKKSKEHLFTADGRFRNVPDCFICDKHHDDYGLKKKWRIEMHSRYQNHKSLIKSFQMNKFIFLFQRY